MVESTAENNTRPIDDQTDSIEEEKKSPPRQQKRKKQQKEKEPTDEELAEIAQGKKIFDGEVSNALQDSQAKKGSNSVRNLFEKLMMTLSKISRNSAVKLTPQQSVKRRKLVNI